MDASRTEVKTLRQAIDKGYRVCLDEVMVPALVTQIDAGMCEVTLVTKDGWYASRSFGEKGDCETKVKLDKTVAVVGVTIPVRSEIERAVSWAITRDVEVGMYITRREEARLNYTYGLCAEVATTETLTQFHGLLDLGGPIVFHLVFASFISFLVTRVGRAVARRTEHLSIWT